MKDKVEVVGEFVDAAFSHMKVSLTRAQVEAALKELNEPEFKAGDVVCSYGGPTAGLRLLVLGKGGLGIVSALRSGAYPCISETDIWVTNAIGVWGVPAKNLHKVGTL